MCSAEHFLVRTTSVKFAYPTDFILGLGLRLGLRLQLGLGLALQLWRAWVRVSLVC